MVSYHFAGNDFDTGMTPFSNFSLIFQNPKLGMVTAHSLAISKILFNASCGLLRHWIEFAMTTKSKPKLLNSERPLSISFWVTDTPLDNDAINLFESISTP